MPAYALAAVALVALLVGVLIGQTAFRAPQPPVGQVARFTLSGHQDMAGVQATVTDLRSDGLALVDFRGLPPPGEGRVYELWLIPAHGSPVPAAVFVPDSSGSKVVLVSRSLAGYAVMAVTNETGPDGAQAPTQQPQLRADVITDMYEAVEALAKIVVGNGADLSANRERFIAAVKASDPYKKLLKGYVEYANDFRHAAEEGKPKPQVSEREAESFVYLTGVFIRLAMP